MTIYKLSDIGSDLPPLPTKISPIVNEQQVKNKAQQVKTHMDAGKSAINNGKEAVSKMQSSLLDLYNKFQTYPLFNQSLANKYIEDYAGGSEDSINFMLNRYLNKAKNLATNQVKNISDSINRLKDITTIRTPTGIKPTGVWDNQTDNALKNLYAIMHGIVGALGQFKIAQNIYTNKDLKNLELAMKERTAENAETINKQIAKINTALDSFIKALYNQSSKKQDTSVLKLNQDSFNEKEMEIATSPIEIPIKITQDLTSNAPGTIPVKIFDLSTIDNFKKFIASNKITIDGKNPTQDPEDLRKSIIAISNKIKNFIEEQKKISGY